MASTATKFDPENVKIAIIGLGYVGLPLAAEFAKRYKVVGFDTGKRRVTELNNGHDRILTVDDDELAKVINPKNENNGLTFTDNIADTAACNFYIVTV